MDTPKIIDNKYDLSNLLLNKDSLESFKCPICFDFIGDNKVPLQCKNGCWSCKKCWEAHFEINGNTCPQCREIVIKKDLVVNRFMEEQFGHQLVCCSNSFKFNSEPIEESEIDDELGCKEIISICQLENHLKECNHKFVICNNDGCNEIIRLNQFQEHHINCKYRLEYCEHCKKGDITNGTLDDHYSICEMKPVPCDQCNNNIERKSINEHILNECDETIVPCKYYNYGCNDKMKRCQLEDHISSSNHLVYIYLDNQKSINEELQKKLISLSNNQQSNYYENKWIIKNYLRTIKDFKTGDRINSRYFKIGTLNHKFYVSIYPFGSNKRSKGNFSMFLFSKIDNYETVASFNLELVNHNNPNLNILVSDKEKKFSDSGSYGWGLKVIEADKILNSNGWLNESGELEINVKVKSSEIFNI